MAEPKAMCVMRRIFVVVVSIRFGPAVLQGHVDRARWRGG